MADEARGTAAGARQVPAFIGDRIRAAYGDEAAARILEGYRAACGRPVTLRANTLKASAGEVASALEAAGIAYARVPWYKDAFVLEGVRERAVWDLPVYKEGKVYLQSLSSMLPPLALEPVEGADVLDMCAAPGGKTAQIAALTQGRAHLTACELSAPRAEKLSYNLAKLGAGAVNIMRFDARRLDEFFSFDQILLDAPCTGTGTVRAGDPHADRITDRLLAKVTRSQRALLDRALTVLKPDGTLVYSTCSILPQENGDQVAAALARHRGCRVVPIGLDGAAAARPEADAASGGDGSPAPWTLPYAAEGDFAIPTLGGNVAGTLTVAPTGLYEGFFLARIQKMA